MSQKTNNSKSQKSQKSTQKSTKSTNCFDALSSELNSRSCYTKTSNSTKIINQINNPVPKNTPVAKPNDSKSQDLTDEQLDELLEPTEKAISIFPDFYLNPYKNMFSRLDFIDDLETPNTIPAFKAAFECVGDMVADMYMRSIKYSLFDCMYEDIPIYVHFLDGSEAVFYIDPEILYEWMKKIDKLSSLEDKAKLMFNYIKNEGFPLTNDFKCSECASESDMFAEYDAIFSPAAYGLMLEVEPDIYVPVI